MAEAAQYNNLELSRPEPDEREIFSWSQRRGEPLQLARFRQEALRLYRGLPLPHRVAHLWRYTDPALLLPQGELFPPKGEAPPQTVGAAPGGVSIHLLPGEAPRLQWSESIEGQSVEILPLAQGGEHLQKLGEAVPAGHGLFEALNGAAFYSGVLVRVPRGVTLSGPLHLVLPAAATTSIPRILVQIEEGAEATVVEDHLGGEKQTHVVGVSEVFVGAGARARYVVLQRWDEGVSGHLTGRIVAEGDAQILSVLAPVGGKRLKLDFGTVLRGPGAQSELISIGLGEGRQQFDLHTEHRHEEGHTWSDMKIRLALQGRARSAYTGLIRIEEQAKVSEAFQENRNLLLSSRARAETIPELEILTDEVRCSHGATVSPVDPEQIFYLQSRGLPATEALRLVVRGFFEEGLRRLPETLRQDIEALVEERVARL